ncbi:unnamed protein product, partial [Ectocarpus fasciculatus]
LVKTLESKTGGALREGLVGLFKRPVDALCAKLKAAADGIGCDEATLTRIIGASSKPKALKIAERYKEKYDVDLRAMIRSETGGNYRTALLTWIDGPDPTKGNGGNMTCTADEYADMLYAAGAGRLGTDEKTFIDVITGRTLQEVQQIAAAYESRHGTSLEAAIRSEFSGSLETGLVNLLHEPLDVYARYMKDFCDGIGTNEEGLNRILGGSDKELVQLISARYFEKYGKTLEETLKSELGGDYKKACL